MVPECNVRHVNISAMVGCPQLLDFLLYEDEAIDEADDEGQGHGAQGHLQHAMSRSQLGQGYLNGCKCYTDLYYGI